MPDWWPHCLPLPILFPVCGAVWIFWRTLFLQPDPEDEPIILSPKRRGPGQA